MAPSSPRRSLDLERQPRQRLTNQFQAFRTLKLLESYHSRLSQLLRFQATHPSHTPETASEEKRTPQSSPSTPPSKTQEEFPYRAQQQQSPHPLPPRDISSSIASNLASARGIPPSRQQRRGSPASPASSTQHAEGKLTTPGRRSKLSDYPSRAAPNPIQEKVQSTLKTPTASPSSQKPPSPPPPLTDEPFNRFYNTFAPLISALSAPLAFAGLPLNLDSSSPSTSNPNQAHPQPPSNDHKTAKATMTTATLSDNPEYTRAFSRAALRALQSERGYATQHESFYVVPTTGHTTSYADILARTQREAAKGLSSVTHTQEPNDDAEFVDARETPQPPSPTSARRGPFGGSKTPEELHLENTALRDLLDVLSKRLAQFEMGSQSQSQALYQSFRLMKQSVPQLPGGANTAAAAAADTTGMEPTGMDATGKGSDRVAALEEQLLAQQREVEKMGRENEKLRGVVGRYRERWEKLKEGARGRREGTGMGMGD